MNQSKQVKWYLKLVALIIIFALLPAVGYAQPAWDSNTTYLEDLVEDTYYYDIPDQFYKITDPSEKIKSLGDPYSQYLTIEEYQEFIQGIDMNFQGIGVYIEQVDEGLLITSVIEQSGAQEAGLQAGDIITAADGQLLEGMPQEKAVSLIKGKEGTSVNLRIKRQSSYFNVTVKRSQIHVPTVQGTLLDNNVAYIIIHSFGQETNLEFYNLLMKLEKQAPLGYILDIRANPGGYLQSAVDLIGYFAGGETALLTKSANEGTRVYAATDHKFLIDKPIILLTNRYSASASEIMAAAFKDHNAGLIIGERTFGKGTVQNMYYDLDGENVKGIVKLTVEQFFSPLGKAINSVGVSPDIRGSDVDPESLAAMFFGKPGSSKRGFMQFSYKGHAYSIDLTEARKPENWQVYGYMIDLHLGKIAELKRGFISQWRTLADDSFSKPWKFYYPEYRELPALTNVESDKQFTITFEGTINSAFLDNGPVELIHSRTGERVPLNLTQEKVNQYKVTPKELLTQGETYYLVIHTGLAYGSHHNGTVVEVKVTK